MRSRPELPRRQASQLILPMLFRALLIVGAANTGARAQIDPFPRSQLEVGLDQSVSGRGPQSLYAYYYYNQPVFHDTNVVLRAAMAPVYFDGELGFRGLLSPHTDLGLGINGGGFGENYYEVRRGNYFREESFDGHGGGGSVHLYQLVNPGRMIPLNLVVQGGAHFSTYSATDRTDNLFRMPEDRLGTSLRAGFRFGGIEPMLYPDLSMEVSVWAERQWRPDSGPYGYGNSLEISPVSDLWWLYAGLSYAWTNSGNQASFALTAGGSGNADRFSAWRLGGVLPLAAELPLTLPGYYYQELSATRFVHLNASYVAPLSASHRWQLRLGAAAAAVRYLPGLEQPGTWHTGFGPALEFNSVSGVWRVILRYGYGLNASRDGNDGAHSVGLLCEYDFGKRGLRRNRAP
jgi:hypothetical protein